MIFEVVNALCRTLILHLLDLLLQPRVENCLDILFELTRVHKIISFGYSHNFDGVEETAKLANCMKDFGERKDRDGVVHEATLQVVHRDLVQVSNRLTSPLIVILQEKLQYAISNKYEFKHAIQNEGDGARFWQSKRCEEHVKE